MSKRLSNNPKKYQTIVVVGRKGAGKSTYIKKEIPKLKVKKSRRFLISPTAEMDGTLEKSFDKENVFLEYDDDIIQHIMDIINDETKELTFKYHHRWNKEEEKWVEIKSRVGKKPKLPSYLLVCDDCMGTSVLKRNGKIETLFSRHRHYRLNLMVVGHSYKYIPVMMRVNSNRLVFYDQNNAELKKIEDEHSRERDNKSFTEMFRNATDKKYGNFVIDYYNDPIY